jgi:hypothetical protein
MTRFPEIGKIRLEKGPRDRKNGYTWGIVNPNGVNTMQKLKPLHVAHADILVSLHDWLRAKRTFGCKKGWPEAYDLHGRIEQAADRIHESVRMLRIPQEGGKEKDFLQNHVYNIDCASIKMNDALYHGTGVMIEHCSHPGVLVAWQDVCGSVEFFARSASEELGDLASKYCDESDRGLFYSARIMGGTADDAVRCREMVGWRNLED